MLSIHHKKHPMEKNISKSLLINNKEKIQIAIEKKPFAVPKVKAPLV
jgi:hypothetical protein